MKSQKPDITEDALLNEAVKLFQKRVAESYASKPVQPGYFTTEQFATKLGINTCSALRKLKKIKADRKKFGLLNKHGQLKMVPHYKIL